MPATIRPNEPPIDQSRHLSEADLHQWLKTIQYLEYSNTVQYLVARNINGSRRVLQSATMDVELGLVEDRWHLDSSRSLNEQVAAMSFPIALGIANGQSLTLFGDGLFLDMDLAQLNIGQQLHVANCILEITPEPHNPCSKFRNRFGHPAFQACLTHRHLQPRGVYLRVIQSGLISIGDSIQVVSNHEHAL